MKINRLGENLFVVKAFWLSGNVLIQAILEIQTKYNKTVTAICKCSGWSDSYVIVTS